MTDHTEATTSTHRFAPLAIIFGIPLIFAALFFYTTPIVLTSSGGPGIFKCGSPSSPNVESKNVCDVPEEIARNKAIYSGLSGAVLIGFGAVGLLRGQRRDDDWDDDETPRRRRDRDDVDLRRDDRHEAEEPLRSRREDDEPLRGVERDTARAEDGLDLGETRAGRRGEPRSRLRDDDFGESARRGLDDTRRGPDDDWSSDGWR